jgi:hypothetical protein
LFKPKEQGVFERFITFETKPFTQITPVSAQADICALPVGAIVASKLVSFAAAFRIYCFEKLNECALTMKQPKPDLIISKFSAIYDNCDTMSVVANCWPVLLTNLNQADLKQERVQMLNQTIKAIYPLMWEGWYKQDRSFPYRTLPAASRSLKVKQYKLKAALLAGNQASAAQLKKEGDALKISQTETVDNYIPFNTAELNVDYLQDPSGDSKFDLFCDEVHA